MTRVSKINLDKFNTYFNVKHNLTLNANCLKRGINLHEMSNAVSLGKKIKIWYDETFYTEHLPICLTCVKNQYCRIKGTGL